jgi:hypothetical protein
MCNNCAYAFEDFVRITVNESIVKKGTVASDLVQPEKFVVLSSSIVKQNEKKAFPKCLKHLMGFQLTFTKLENYIGAETIH